MPWKQLLEENKLQKKRVSSREVQKVLDKAHKCTKAAKLLLEKDVDESVFKEAYDSMILAGRALMFSLGLKPRTVGSHTITIDFCSEYLGSDFRLLIQKFKRMKRKRNYLIYGIGLVISKTEAENALKTAGEFVDKITKLIQKNNPQQELI
jgi:uncharacterized protein (UPF0332 family)